ncbi:unknown protein (plasmid) [Synechocystis sp. PCC 6803]|uniref:Uncharacterized protein n=1 Tax=Synechocystis sp. (strain ATCC 27184 / PCC 6803 / Kazusa) TaxID=1111708 RepID=Q6ZEQ9_SYNY3|nr:MULTISPECIES: helix-turn-helix transcriptional regulator [unclassified Synechocystis]AGF53498.1 hypothetical protein MYO_2720 [Synechocystis sp. PCC 6803]AVP91618.1 XRE family transcriptional regulator [Synechocystis sp. IPPAS B-1465]MBD2619896.1 helix-turn-helix transcriptional regulator [Synechocystis sp. FACHB-898]MBD2640813.1 helix-turn-helix transcriptional regulator [Synechocystis sp. FACHB-908]MBD2662695.1 helix-turn-helix transcriptional regulator [Synechocystis sp. FACHB-929]
MDDRDLVKIFKVKLSEQGIRQTEVCQEAGKPQSHLSKLLCGGKSPNLQTLLDFINATDRLYPGFADQYWLAVAGRPTIRTLVDSMDSTELAVLLKVVGDRVAEAKLKAPMMEVA